MHNFESLYKLKLANPAALTKQQYTYSKAIRVAASCNTHILLENDNTNDKPFGGAAAAAAAASATLRIFNLEIYFLLYNVYQVFCLPYLSFSQIDGGLTFWLDITRYCHAYRD